MSKVLVIASMAVSGLIPLLFLLDLALRFPFQRPHVWMEIFFSVAAALVLYLAYEMYREVA